ncbi:AAA family ATPase, partial [Salmonella enterica]|uniref:AAA family ATPase n=1 Tax=Salmonella enterica TaxID=28901 RepID=UPI003D2E5D61
TFIAKAFAEEAGANFLPLSAVALAAADSGSVGENILDTLARALKQAKKTQKPTVLFLDHLDHLASRRGADESPTEE